MFLFQKFCEKVCPQLAQIFHLLALFSVELIIEKKFEKFFNSFQLFEISNFTMKSNFQEIIEKKNWEKVSLPKKNPKVDLLIRTYQKVCLFVALICFMSTLLACSENGHTNNKTQKLYVRILKPLYPNCENLVVFLTFFLRFIRIRWNYLKKESF